jgi:hypothetical protein
MTMSRAGYEIRVAGEVPPQVIDDFQLIVMAVDPVGTTMRAEVLDESGLHGILDALRRAGIELLDVRREPAFGAADQPGASEEPYGG